MKSSKRTVCAEERFGSFGPTAMFFWVFGTLGAIVAAWGFAMLYTTVRLWNNAIN